MIIKSDTVGDDDEDVDDDDYYSNPGGVYNCMG